MYAEPKEIKDAIDGIKSDSFDDQEKNAVLNLTKIASAFTSRHNKTQDEIMSSFNKLGELMSNYDNAVSECGSAEHLTEAQIENGKPSYPFEDGMPPPSRISRSALWSRCSVVTPG